MPAPAGVLTSEIRQTPLLGSGVQVARSVVGFLDVGGGHGAARKPSAVHRLARLHGGHVVNKLDDDAAETGGRGQPGRRGARNDDVHHLAVLRMRSKGSIS